MLISDVATFVNKSLMGLLLGLDGIVYDFVRWFYEIFLFLKGLNLFQESDYMSIVSRIYIIIGVVMLFVLAYSLLRAVIDPDQFAKDEMSVPKLIKNVVISLIMIVMMPLVFRVAYSVQNAVLNWDVIGKIFLSEQYTTHDITNGGNVIASNVFGAFFYAEEGSSPSSNTGFFKPKGTTLEDAWRQVNDEGATYRIFSNFSEAVATGEIHYSYLISTLAGLFLLWCILLFCFDLGIRVIKLIFYQIIAPIAIIARILPGSKTKDIFPSWMKSTITTFLEVFIRVFVMYMGVYLIMVVSNNLTADHGIWTQADAFGLGGVQKSLVLAFIILGIIAFVRQAPKLIQDIFKLETGGLNLGFKGLSERLEQGGAYAIGSGVGSLASTGVRNVVAGVKNFRSAKGQGWKKRAAALGRIPFSAAGGALSGGIRGIKRGASAKSLSEMKEAASGATKAATTARKRRAANKERYRSKGLVPGTGKVYDFMQDVQNWATGGASQYEEQIKKGADFKKVNDAILDEAEKLIEKNKNEAALLRNINIDWFKGTDAAEKQRLFDTFNEYFAGMSMGAIDAYLEQQSEITDFSQFVDKESSEFFDAEAYNEARDEALSRINKDDYYGEVDTDALDRARREAMAKVDRSQFIDRVSRLSGKIIIDENAYAEACRAAADAVDESLFRAFDEEKYEFDRNAALNTVQKSDFIDQDAYNQAIEEREREHARTVSQLQTIRNQVYKATKLDLVNTAIAGEDAGSITTSKMEAIRGKVAEFTVMYEAEGSYVKDPVTGSAHGRIDTSEDRAKAIDDIATAYTNIGNQASEQAARYRIEQESRGKKDN